jgi:hypothetical protein
VLADRMTNLNEYRNKLFLFMALPHNLVGGADENNKKPQSE